MDPGIRKTPGFLNCLANVSYLKDIYRARLWPSSAHSHRRHRLLLKLLQPFACIRFCFDIYSQCCKESISACICVSVFTNTVVVTGRQNPLQKCKVPMKFVKIKLNTVSGVKTTQSAVTILLLKHSTVRFPNCSSCHGYGALQY